jgi:hypothetical protein
VIPLFFEGLGYDERDIHVAIGPDGDLYAPWRRPGETCPYRQMVFRKPGPSTRTYIFSASRAMGSSFCMQRISAGMEAKT